MILFFLLALFACVLHIFYWVADYFTGRGIDESVIYHLRYGLSAAGFGEYLEVITTTFAVLVATISILLLTVLGKGRAGKDRRHLTRPLPYVLLAASLLMHPGVWQLRGLLLPGWNPLAVFAAERETAPVPRFDSFYRLPQMVAVSEPKNLVFIYAEGLERTYFDQRLFPGLVKDLRELEKASTSFTNIRQAANTGWTIGGMVASQCGIPLVAASHGNSMSGMDEFLPSAVCLGDLLHNEGYHLVYYGGSSLQFAGKGKFYAAHGFDEIAGREELSVEMIDSEYKTGWGLYDDALFDLAYRKFLDLSAAEEKFALFLLTLDTHHPAGHPSKSCEGLVYGDGSNPILNAVACSDRLISEFVRRVADSPFGGQTTVVIASDHLSLNNTASKQLEKGDRRNLFMVLSPDDSPAQVEVEGSNLDVGSTLLPFIGYHGEIGLGRDLTRHDAEISSETAVIRTNLKRWGEPLSGFWDFPEVKEHLLIDVKEGFLEIDRRRFGVPVLVEFKSDMRTTLRFQFDANRFHKTLYDHVMDLEVDTPFLWIDSCKEVDRLFRGVGRTGDCAAIGGNKLAVESFALDGRLEYSRDQLQVHLFD